MSVQEFVPAQRSLSPKADAVDEDSKARPRTVAFDRRRAGKAAVPSRNRLLRRLVSLDGRLRAHLRPLEMRKGDVLIDAGETLSAIVFPATSLVSSRIPFETGEEVECMLSGRDSAIGLLATAGLRVSPLRSLCLTDGHACSMPLAHLAAAAEALPGIASVLEQACRAQVQFALRIGACNAVHTTGARLARWLLIASDLLDGAPIAISQEELGIVLGVRRTAINPLLQKLQTPGILSISRARISVLDRRRLSFQACSCHLSLSAAPSW
jgi:CRP-like cAMP-binding protein